VSFAAYPTVPSPASIIVVRPLATLCPARASNSAMNGRISRKAYPRAELECLERAKRGDMDAHAQLYQAFAPMVYTLARRMLASPAHAEDVLQETFVEIIRSISTWRGDGEFGLWVRRIAVNKCLMHLRSSWVSRRGELDGEPASPPAFDDGITLERAL